MVFICVIGTKLVEINFSTSECCFTSTRFCYLPNSEYPIGIIGISLNCKEILFEGFVEKL